MKFVAVMLVVLVLLVTPVFASAPEEPDTGSNSQTVILEEVADPVAVSDLDSLYGSRSSFIDALESIFGEYQPLTYTVTTYLPDGSAVLSTEVVPGVAGLDWAWISGIGLFALFLFCLMRLLGGVVK